MEINGFCRIISAAWVGCLSRRSLVLGTTWHPLSAYSRPPAPHILPMVPASPADSMDTTGPGGPMISPYHPKTVGKRQCHRARRPMRRRSFARRSRDDGHPRPFRRHAQAKSAPSASVSHSISSEVVRLLDKSLTWIPVSNGRHRDGQQMTTIRSGVQEPSWVGARQRAGDRREARASSQKVLVPTKPITHSGRSLSGGSAEGRFKRPACQQSSMPEAAHSNPAMRSSSSVRLSATSCRSSRLNLLAHRRTAGVWCPWSTSSGAS